MPVRSFLVHIAGDSTLRGRSSPREASQEATQWLVQLQAENRKDWIALSLLRRHSLSSSRSLHQSLLGRRAWPAKRMSAQEAICTLLHYHFWIKIGSCGKAFLFASLNPKKRLYIMLGGEKTLLILILIKEKVENTTKDWLRSREHDPRCW